LTEDEIRAYQRVQQECRYLEQMSQESGDARVLQNSFYQRHCAGTAISDPGTAAREAVAFLGLQPPRMGITPSPGPGSVGLVGLPNWMWVDNPDAQTFGPASATASIDAWTLTLSGHVESVDWDMGDGQVIRCNGPGTPYDINRHGFQPSPDCGHVYTKQGVFTVTATAHWRVSWTTPGGNQDGTFLIDQVASEQITIGEWQVLRKKN